MTFHYKYTNNAKDIWMLSMMQMYTSMVGVVNIVFTAAVCAATVTLWNEWNIWIRLFMIPACLLFVLIQPFFVWLKAKKRAAGFTDATDLLFNESGLHVMVKDKKEDISWSNIKAAVKKPGFIIVYSGRAQGYVIPDRIMGKDKNNFFKYLSDNIKISNQHKEHGTKK